MRWIPLFLGLMACNGSPPDCVDLDAGTCAATDGCATITGYALGDEGGELCEDPGATAEVVGCQDAGLSCPAVEVYGQPGDDTPGWLVPAGCLPDGWAPLEGPFPTCAT